MKILNDTPRPNEREREKERERVKSIDRRIEQCSIFRHARSTERMKERKKGRERECERVREREREREIERDFYFLKVHLGDSNRQPPV